MVSVQSSEVYGAAVRLCVRRRLSGHCRCVRLVGSRHPSKLRDHRSLAVPGNDAARTSRWRDGFACSRPGVALAEFSAGPVSPRPGCDPALGGGPLVLFCGLRHFAHLPASVTSSMPQLRAVTSVESTSSAGVSRSWSESFAGGMTCINTASSQRTHCPVGPGSGLVNSPSASMLQASSM